MANRTEARITIEGEKEIRDLMRNMGELATAILTKASFAGATIALGKAKELVPVRTGKLKQSLVIKKVNSKSPTREMHSIGPQTKGDASVRYGGFVEFGVPSRGIPPKPYLRPAVDNNQDVIAAAVNSVIDDELKKVMR